MLSKLKEIVKTTLKIIWDIIVVVFLLLLLLFIYLNFGSAPQASNPQYGVTFSKLFAEQLQGPEFAESVAAMAEKRLPDYG